MEYAIIVPARLKNLFSNNPHQDSNFHFNLVACVLSMMGTQTRSCNFLAVKQPAVIPRFFATFFCFYALLTAITDTLVQTSPGICSNFLFQCPIYSLYRAAMKNYVESIGLKFDLHTLLSNKNAFDCVCLFIKSCKKVI